MRDAAGFVLICILFFIVLAMRRIYVFWFGKKVTQKPTEQVPTTTNIQVNHNTFNVIIVKEPEQ